MVCSIGSVLLMLLVRPTNFIKTRNLFKTISKTILFLYSNFKQNVPIFVSFVLLCAAENIFLVDLLIITTTLFLMLMLLSLLLLAALINPIHCLICLNGGYCVSNSDCVPGAFCSIKSSYYSQCLPITSNSSCIATFGTCGGKKTLLNITSYKVTML